jgi:hypothetical protein
MAAILEHWAEHDLVHLGQIGAARAALGERA